MVNIYISLIFRKVIQDKKIITKLLEYLENNRKEFNLGFNKCESMARGLSNGNQFFLFSFQLFKFKALQLILSELVQQTKLKKSDLDFRLFLIPESYYHKLLEKKGVRSLTVFGINPSEEIIKILYPIPKID